MIIGAVALSEKAKRLEAAAKDGNEEILLEESEPFFMEYKAILKYLEEL